MTDEVLKKILDIDGKVEIPFIVMKSLRKVRGFKVGDVITFDGNIPLNTKFKFNSLPPGGQKVCRNKEEVLRNEWIFIQSGNDDCGVDDRLSDEVLKSSGRLKQEVNNE